MYRSSVARLLAGLGHDVVSIYDESPGLKDDQVLERAMLENRIVITNDRDFGQMIFRDGKGHRGDVFLRLEDERPGNKIRVIDSLLANHSEQLIERFVVVTESEVRFSDS